MPFNIFHCLREYVMLMQISNKGQLKKTTKKVDILKSFPKSDTFSFKVSRTRNLLVHEVTDRKLLKSTSRG